MGYILLMIGIEVFTHVMGIIYSLVGKMTLNVTIFLKKYILLSNLRQLLRS